MDQCAATSFDAASSTLVMTDLVVADPAIVTEAGRWTGQRGAAVDAHRLIDVDLSPFVRQALSVGVQAITAAGSSQDKLEFAQLVDQLGAKTI